MINEENQFNFVEGEEVYMLNPMLSNNNWGIIEECAMSTGRVSVPRYYINGSWYYENELEPVLYSVLVATIGWVLAGVRSYQKAKDIYNYYMARDEAQVSLWKTHVDTPIEEYEGEGAL